MKIIRRSVSDLIPYARNARTHSDAQIAQIAGSIREFGFRSPVLIDGENGIIAGHGRVEAARKLGLAEVPCIDCSDMSETQKRAFALADNRIALNAGWDDAMLGLELADLADLEADLEALGFSPAELEQLVGEVPDFAPAHESDQGRLDAKADVTCPNCGHAFQPG
jgi:ParB-like chromosome segregation protein Spo0J